MNDPYLWDGSGEPDPEVQRLESLLAQFRHREIPLALPQEAPAKPGYLHGLLLQFPWLPRFAAVALIILALITGGIFAFRPTSHFHIPAPAGKLPASMAPRKSARNSLLPDKPAQSFA